MSKAHTEVSTSARGWHARGGAAPCRGRGSATVEPIRKRQHIDKIKALLALRPRDLALFIVGIHFGLRGSDLIALHWDDVLSASGHIREHVVVIEQKTGKARTIRVQATAAEALQAWHAVSKASPQSYVFPSRKGGKMTIQRLHQLVVEWTQQAGVSGNYGSHSLRKTFGYHLRMAGVDIVRLMTIFNHSSPAITLRYLGVEQTEIDEAVEKLSL